MRTFLCAQVHSHRFYGGVIIALVNRFDIPYNGKYKMPLTYHTVNPNAVIAVNGALLNLGKLRPTHLSLEECR